MGWKWGEGGKEGGNLSNGQSLTASVALIGNSYSSCREMDRIRTSESPRSFYKLLEVLLWLTARHQDYDVYRFWKLLMRFQFTFRIETCADCILQAVGKHREDLCKRQLDILEWCLSEDEKWMGERQDWAESPLLLGDDQDTHLRGETMRTHT